MSLISSAIPNLVQGVSQQSPALRLPSQAETQVNAYPSLVEGLQKRPPLEHVSILSNSTTTNSFSHLINRDTTERYFMFINGSNALSVYDLAGSSKTVNYTNGTGYLTCTNASTAFKAVTVADHTFVVNTEKTVAMNTATTPTYPFTGLIAVKQGDYNSRFTVYLDNTNVADIVTDATDQAETRTDDIASRLATAINANANFTAVADGSTVIINKTGNATFNIATYDSLGDTGLSPTIGTVQRFDDLPSNAPHGYIAEVTGDQTNNFDSYYVKFVSNNSGNAGEASQGVWNETVKPGITYELDASTMPHLLVREANGTFTLKQADWGDRAVGDLESIPNPTFVGNKINDVFFFQNRFGVLSGENVIMSRVSEYYDFFSTTARVVLDGDPIDLAASHTKVSTLQHAIAFDRKLLLFADQTQFILKGGDFLTSKNASIAQTTTYQASTTARPAAAGSMVYFPATRGGFTALREYFVIDDTDRSDAVDITSHVAKFVPSGVYQMSASTAENILAVLTTSETGSIYVYKYHFAGKEKMQSAWFKYTFSGLTILNAEFIESSLYVLGNKSGKTILLKIQFDAGRFDTNQTYVTRLDFRFVETDCTRTYDSASNKTTITIPFAITSPFVVTRGTSHGTNLPITDTVSTTQFKVSGNHASTEFYIGEKYTMQYEFSEPVLKEGTAQGGRVAITGGRLQIKHWLLRYQDTGDFSVKVEVSQKDTNTYNFTGRIIGGGENVLGTTTLTSGDFRFPVMSKAERLKVTIESTSHLPCQFLSAEWEGSLHLRSRRINAR